MIILGIESTAHTFGAAVIDDSLKGEKAILSNVKRMATTEKGGLIPNKVAEHHEIVFDEVIEEALIVASQKIKKQLTIRNIDLLAVSDAPGIGHALRVGVAIGRSIALRYDIPLVGVNHCIAHLEITRLVTPAKDPVLLYCSGANTQIIAYEGGKYRIFGETLDTGIGNFLDSFARELGLGFPGGPKIEQLAKEYSNPEQLLELPYSVKGMDLSFSGILTNLTQKINSSERQRKDNGWSHEALAFSTQETVFAMLVEVAERAMAHCNKKELVLGGGVGCNRRLQEMCSIMCTERGAKFYVPSNQFLVDNAAMIAWTGKVMYDSGIANEPELFRMKQYERTDDVKVSWR